MADNIRTRWHRVLAAVLEGRVGIHAGPKTGGLVDPLAQDGHPYVELRDLMELIDEMPKYYIEPELMRIASEDDSVNKSVQAMYEAGIDSLPFDAQLVEVDGTSGDPIQQVRNFVVLQTRGRELRLPEEEIFHPYRATLFRLTSTANKDLVLLAPSTYFLALDPHADDHMGGTGFGIHYYTVPAPFAVTHPKLIEMMKNTQEKDVQSCTDVLFAMLVLLNTRGIKKEIVFPERLNAARKKQGKREIPRHTVIRVGHVYSSDGKRREVPGWSQRFHMRAGYTATRWIGPRDGSQKPKLVTVAPYLVNYDPANPDAKPKRPIAHVKW